MDFDALLAPVVAFSSTDAGKIFTEIAKVFWELISPSNAPALTRDM